MSPRKMSHEEESGIGQADETGESELLETKARLIEILAAIEQENLILSAYRELKGDGEELAQRTTKILEVLQAIVNRFENISSKHTDSVITVVNSFNTLLNGKTYQEGDLESIRAELKMIELAIIYISSI